MDTKKVTELVLYKSGDGTVQLDAQLERETIGLSLAQMCDLFGRDQSVVSRHVRNVFKEGELSGKSNMQKMHIGGSGKPVAFYSLDVIISVGYRVKSQRGTDFRLWATRVLQQHVVKGYTLNEKRLKEMKQTLKLASDISKRKTLSDDEASVLLQTVSEYTGALDLFDDYDHQRVAIGKMSRRKAARRKNKSSPPCSPTSLGGKDEWDIFSRKKAQKVGPFFQPVVR